MKDGKTPSTEDPVFASKRDRPRGASGRGNGCLVYTRVSTDRQAEHGYSLAQQEDACRRFAAQRGLEVLDVFTDGGESGTSTSRPRFQALLERAIDDPRVRAIVVIHTDRFARNVHDHVTVKGRLLRHGVEVLAVLQPMCDGSPEGDLVDTVLAGINAFYSRDLGRKVSKALAHKAQGGGWCGPAPVGYRNATDEETGKRLIVPDAQAAPLVQVAFAEYATGTFSAPRLAEHMAGRGLVTRGGRPLSTQRMLDLLRNPVYIGKIAWKGQLFAGLHEPIVDPHQFARVQEVLALHNQGGDRARKHVFRLTGLLRCVTCEQLLTAEEHVKPSGRSYRYYRCIPPGGASSRCTEPGVREERLDAAVHEALENVELSAGMVAALGRTLDACARDGERLEQARRRHLEAKRTALRRRAHRLEELLLAEAFDHDRGVQERHRLAAEIDAIEADLRDGGKNAEARLPADFHADLDVLHHLTAHYDRLPQQRQRLLLRCFVDRIWVAEQCPVRIEWTQGFEDLRALGAVRTDGISMAALDLLRTLGGFRKRATWNGDKVPHPSCIISIQRGQRLARDAQAVAAQIRKE